jgi:hypothetical protein
MFFFNFLMLLQKLYLSLRHTVSGKNLFQSRLKQKKISVT